MEQLITREGNYSKGQTRIKIETNEQVDNAIIVICIHGLYGETGDAGSKSVLLGAALENAARGIVYISTSRDWSLYGSADDRAAAFAQKTFAQEQADVKDTIDMIREQSRELFGVAPNRLRFWIVANSMGGSLASTIVAQYPEIEKVALCGSGILPSSRSLPILSTYPEEESIRNAAGMFKGDLLHLRGSNDTTVSELSQQGLFEAYGSARSARQVVINGANHNFSSIFDKNQQKAYAAYVKIVMDFLLERN
jgi:alpha-beta hydrolase superfamily lysophospholipase